MSSFMLMRFVCRESRGSRLRLALLAATLVIGVALLVVLNILTTSIRYSFEINSRALLGADLVFVKREAWDPRSEALLAKIPGLATREISFLTMAANREREGRLVFVRGVGEAFPLYGTVETDPPDALKLVQQGQFALVERTVLVERGLSIGDTIRLGDADFVIKGTVEQIPGESPIGELIAPRVFVSERYVGETGLLKFGSRVSYRAAFRLPDGVDAERLVADLGEEIDQARLTSETVKQRRRSIEGIVRNLDRFLHLGGLAVIVLAGFGIGHGTAAFLAQKQRTIAMLRCLGASRRWIGSVFVLQMAIAAIGASLFGAALGVSLVLALPALLRDVLPIALEVQMLRMDIVEGFLLGVLIPLICIVPALRRAVRTPPNILLGGRESSDRGRWSEWIAPAVFLLGVLLLKRRFSESAILLLGLGACTGILMLGIGALLRFGRRRGSEFPFAVRQAFRHLGRPGNQTLALGVGLAYAVLLPAVLVIVSAMLNTQMTRAGSAGKANTVLFGVDPPQIGELTRTLEELGHSVIESVPVVTMRLLSVEGRTVREILSADDSKIPEWTLRREYRSTYRSSLIESESLTSGTLVPTVTPADEPVPITIESSLAEKLGVGLGARLDFDVQGVPVRAVISGLREVQWQQIRPNFFLVFPEGVLNDAPQTRILTTRTEGISERVKLERILLERFPNISFIDLHFVLTVLDSVLVRISLGARILSGALTLTAGLIALSIMLNDFGLRVREYALLKVLGARRSQLLAILTSEYIVVSLAAAGVAVGCAVGVSAALLRYVFELQFDLPFSALIGTALIAVVATALFGILVSSAVLRASPLRVLRQD